VTNVLTALENVIYSVTVVTRWLTSSIGFVPKFTEVGFFCLWTVSIVILWSQLLDVSSLVRW